MRWVLYTYRVHENGWLSIQDVYNIGADKQGIIAVEGDGSGIRFKMSSLGVAHHTDDKRLKMHLGPHELVPDDFFEGTSPPVTSTEWHGPDWQERHEKLEDWLRDL